MRIGIDARELCGRPTGVGRYLSGLLDQWAAGTAHGHEFVLYAPGPFGREFDGRRFATRLVSGPAGTRWEQFRMPAVAARDQLDVFFSPGYTTPLFRRTPTVVAIHDISFAARPEWYSTREGVRRRWLSRQAALGAKAVITISEFSRGEIVERLGIAAEKVHVVPPGITSPRLVRHDGSRGPHVLFVGSIFNRRQLPLLIRAFGPVARRHPGASLDIVGDNRSYPRQDLPGVIAHEGLTGAVRWREWVPDEELATLYARSRAFAFLSEYEGLGLTPLEALSVGVPGVLLDTPVAHESCGDAALYVGLDADATTRALEGLLFAEPIRQRLLAAAPAVLGRYNWRDAARETLTIIEDAATGSKARRS